MPEPRPTHSKLARAWRIWCIACIVVAGVYVAGDVVGILDLGFGPR